MGDCIPIQRVVSRRNHKKYRPQESSYYPLYESCLKDSYNFLNILESISNWNSFSDNVGRNLNQVLNLIEAVERNNDQDQLNEAITIVNDKIIPYLESPLFFKNIINRNKSISESTKNIFIDRLNEETECDRVLNNHKIVSKRFNIDKVISSNIYYPDAFTETVYTLCSLIDTYNMNLKSKFCTSSELGLYGINECNHDIDQKLILENIIDYFIIYHGVNDIDKLSSVLKEAAREDIFIDNDIVDDYLSYINKINEEVEEEVSNFDEEVIKKYNDDNQIYNEDYMNLSSSLRSICEVAFMDRARDIITKIKIAPVKTVSMVKEAIRSLLVTSRLQDIKKDTNNVLSLIFYAGITASFIAISPVASLLGLASSIIISKHMNKEYLKESIYEWKEHKYSVTRKIKDCNDPEKKRKLTIYLEEVNKNIEILEKEYEKVRDKTVSELNSDEKKTVASPKFKVKPFQVNPIGKEINFNKYNSDESDQSTSNNLPSSDSSSNGNSGSDDDDVDVQAYINKIKNE